MRLGAMTGPMRSGENSSGRSGELISPLAPSQAPAVPRRSAKPPSPRELERALLVEPQHLGEAPKGQEVRDADREVEDVAVAEVLVQPPEELVIDREVIERKPL